MQLCSLASGSNGNSIYIGTKQTHLIVDAGISKKRVLAGLDHLGISPQQIDGLLITHEHLDHISGLGVVARGLKIPIYTTVKTWQAIRKIPKLGMIDESLLRWIEPDQSFFINEVEIKPFRISHDAVEPISFTFQANNSKIGFATDLGIYDQYTIEQLKDSNILYIEANHDVNMLQMGGYPYPLKMRILSDLGHLSNELSRSLISELVHDKMEHIVLAHLSGENNHPDIAYLEIEDLINRLRVQNGWNITVSVAQRGTYSEPVRLAGWSKPELE